MQHDPKIYSDPMVFRPSRFLGSNPEPDPRQICFGFGRRQVLVGTSSALSLLTSNLGSVQVCFSMLSQMTLHPTVGSAPRPCDGGCFCLYLMRYDPCRLQYIQVRGRWACHRAYCRSNNWYNKVWCRLCFQVHPGVIIDYTR